MEISLRTLFRDFNASKFVTYCSLLVFVSLFALRLDGILNAHYLVVFFPLWISEGLVFIGAVIAFISYLFSPPSPSDVSLRYDFYAMIMCTCEHVLLFMFEALCCYKLQSEASFDVLPWLLVFAPLFALCLLSIVVAIWSIRHDKSFEMELFFSVNVVQFVFIAFKLDATIDWHWAIIFVPLWVVLSLSVVGVLYALVLAVVLNRSIYVLATHRRQHLCSAVCHALLVIPMLIFLLLLTGKLDAVARSEEEPVPNISFLIVSVPLIISLFSLVLMSFGSRGGNPWWFNMRLPFCTFLLEKCPFLKQYANLSYKFGRSSSLNDNVLGDLERQSLQSELCRCARVSLRPVVPISTIESPD
ncbi:hypothetical protein AB6A40_009108 [Gnathostoma spinigerum]|uniref:Transmembrane protein 185B n=1 Tax=Gnathostoma spinigerum TaxID=75299 RepID=A0ABD6EYS6_9BILA